MINGGSPGLDGLAMRSAMRLPGREYNMRVTQLKGRAGMAAITFVLVAGLPATSASAQEADESSAPATDAAVAVSDPAASAEPAEARMGSIVVTARKREEQLRDIPESITALTGADLTARGVTTVADLGRQTPGLQLNKRQDNTPNVAIRGVGSFGNVQGVGFYIDDVQNFTDQTMRLEDQERVEILKGPQGTLYGGSAIGGAVKYITAKPTFDTYATGTFDIGEQNYRNYYAAVNTPVASDVLAVRLSGYLTEDDGFVRDSNLGIWSSEFREYGARAQALLELDRFSGLLALRYRKYDGPGFAYVRQSDIDTPRYDSTLSFRPSADRETVGLTSTLSYDFDTVELTSISSYTEQDYNYNIDTDYLPAPTQRGIISDPHKAKVLTQEMPLASQANSNLDWIVGLYGQRLDNINSIPTPVDVVLFGGAVSIPRFSDRTMRQEDFAAFGTVNLDLGNVNVEGGLRWLD